MKLTPASLARSRLAKLTPSSHWWPKVIVPRQISDTFSPVDPRRLIFMAGCSSIAEEGLWLLKARTRLQLCHPKRAPVRQGSLSQSASQSTTELEDLNGTLSLHPRPFLPAAAGEPVAGGGRAAGFGLPVPRLERAHQCRVLRPQRLRPHPRRRGPDRPPGE